MSLGFKQADAEVYVLLAKNGSQKARDIVEALKTSKRQVYRILRKLQRRGMVNVSQERSARFSAVSFDKVLDQFIKMNRDEAERIEENKEQILSIWHIELWETSKVSALSGSTSLPKTNNKEKGGEN